jgi:superfamily I DNA and/or RNA helicase
MDVRQSDFQRAFESSYGETAAVTLRTQYRMVEPICRLVSDCFYPETPLETGRGASPNAFSQLPDPMNSHVVWFDTSSEKTRERKVKTSFENEYEAKIVLRILEKLSTTDILLAEENDEGAPVGVICTYAAQKWLILKYLSEAPWATELRNRRLVKVDTVDAYQGRQNQIVLLSLTRNNAHGDQGFVGRTPRINVSLSRAQQRLYIVGALDMWTTHNKDSAMGTVASYLQQRADSATYRIVPASRIGDEAGRL